MSQSIETLRKEFEDGLNKLYIESSNRSTLLLEDLQSKQQPVHHQNSSSELSEEELINEIQDQQFRKNNVMLFNLPVSHHSDLSAVQNIIKELTNEELPIVKATRFGKKNRNGHQAIKVVLSNQNDARKILTAKKDVLKSRKIFVSFDMTLRQRSHMDKLKRELTLRRENGETDISIKYSGGVPKIVKSEEMKARKN
nr:unnamed protein product [Callosobruchus chinensis]